MDPQNTYSVLSEGEPAIHEMSADSIDKYYNNNDNGTGKSSKTRICTEFSNLTLRPRVLNPEAAKFLDDLHPTIHKQVTRLLEHHAQKQRYKEAYQAELLALEKKYLSKYKPLYDNRAIDISGANLSCDLRSIMDGFAGPTVAIPEFWLMVMQNNPSIGDLIEAWDEEALCYLTDIRVQLLQAPELGYRLDFVFAKNEFFNNKVLRKTYTYEKTEDGQLFYGEVIGTVISWKAGKELPPQNHGTSDESDDEPPASFFDFFNPPNLTPADDEESDILEMKVELDYGYGEIFKEKLIPDAVEWYIGEARGVNDGAFDEEEEEN